MAKGERAPDPTDANSSGKQRSRWKFGLKSLIIIAGLLAAFPAAAIPPMGPRPAEAAVVQAYAAALERNDLAVLSTLIGEDAKISDEAGKLIRREDWLASGASEAAVARRTQILNAFSGYASYPGQAIRRFMFVIEFTSCHPKAAECFPQWRTETITVDAGKIIALQTSNAFDLRRTTAGDWTFYDQ